MHEAVVRVRWQRGGRRVARRGKLTVRGRHALDAMLDTRTRLCGRAKYDRVLRKRHEDNLDRVLVADKAQRVKSRARRPTARR